MRDIRRMRDKNESLNLELWLAEEEVL